MCPLKVIARLQPQNGTEPQACGNNKDKSWAYPVFPFARNYLQTVTLLILTVPAPITLLTSQIRKLKQRESSQRLYLNLSSSPSN